MDHIRIVDADSLLRTRQHILLCMGMGLRQPEGAVDELLHLSAIVGISLIRAQRGEAHAAVDRCTRVDVSASPPTEKA